MEVADPIPPTLIRANQINLADVFAFTNNNTHSGAEAFKTINAILFADQYSGTGTVAAPANTPTLQWVSAGGTVAANSYKCQVTFVGATSGETTASTASASVTTTTGVSTLACQNMDLPAPAGATGYNVYWQTGGVGSFFLGHSAVALNAADQQTTTPPTTGTTPPGSNTALAILPTVQTALGGTAGTVVLPSSLSTSLGAPGIPLAGQTFQDWRTGAVISRPIGTGSSPSHIITSPGVFTNGPMNTNFMSVVNGCNPLNEFHMTFDPRQSSTSAFSACLSVPGTSTVQQANVIEAYAIDSRANPLTPTVAIFGVGRAAATNARVWGGNFVAMDAGFVGTSNSLYAGENDCFIVNVGSTCRGLLIEGFWEGGIQPTTAFGIEVGQPQGAVANPQWTYGLRFDQGATTTPTTAGGAAIGLYPVATGVSQNSQGMQFISTRSDGAQPIGLLYQQPAGDLFWSTSAAGTAGLICSGCNSIRPGTVNTTDLGSAALPFVNLWLGNTATNGVKLTGIGTGARVATLPDNTGTISELNVAQAWTAIQNFPNNTAALTADWTCGTAGTVASCVAATIIGSGGGVPLTFTLPLVAQSYTLECDGVVGQATAVTANNWNLLTATNGATNVTTFYDMYTAATAKAGGATTDQTSTTTTFNIGPAWTLGAIATKMPFHIYAKIEGASVSGTVVSLQLVAPTVADLVTIYRGASCRIF